MGLGILSIVFILCPIFTVFIITYIGTGKPGLSFGFGVNAIILVRDYLLTRNTKRKSQTFQFDPFQLNLNYGVY